MNYELIGENIRTMRTHLGISQEKLSEMANISRQHLGAIERGEKTASLETIVQIANALSVPIGELLGNNVDIMDDENILTDCTEIERHILVENMAELKEILRKYKN